MKIMSGGVVRNATAVEVAAIEAAQVKVIPTATQLDDQSEGAAKAFIEENPGTKAMMLLMRDHRMLIKGITKQEAGQELRAEYKAYYRAAIE